MEHDFGAQVLNFFLCVCLVMGPEIPNCNHFEADFPSGVSALPVWVYFLGAQLHNYFFPCCHSGRVDCMDHSAWSIYYQAISQKTLLVPALFNEHRTVYLKVRAEIYFKI